MEMQLFIAGLLFSSRAKQGKSNAQHTKQVHDHPSRPVRNTGSYSSGAGQRCERITIYGLNYCLKPVTTGFVLCRGRHWIVRARPALTQHCDAV